MSERSSALTNAKKPKPQQQGHPAAPTAATAAAPSPKSETSPRQRARRSDAGTGRSSDPNQVQVNVRLPRELHTQLKLHAVSAGQKPSDVVEAALLSYLDR